MFNELGFAEFTIKRMPNLGSFDLTISIGGNKKYKLNNSLRIELEPRDYGIIGFEISGTDINGNPIHLDASFFPNQLKIEAGKTVKIDVNINI